MLVVIDQCTRRLVGFGVQCGAVTSAPICRMFNAHVTVTILVSRRGAAIGAAINCLSPRPRLRMPGVVPSGSLRAPHV
jgi:hypothetical protein